MEPTEEDQALFKGGYYGESIVGSWFCPKCWHEEFPLKLRDKGARKPFLCPKDGTPLQYDEAA